MSNAYQNMKVANTLIFDFDGTIADSFEKTLGAIIKISKDFGIGEISEKDIGLYRSGGAKEIIKKAKVPIHKIPFLIKRGQEEVSKVIGSIKPFRGMVEVISDLKRSGLKLGILTTNTADNVNQFLKNNKIENFDLIYSGSSVFGKGKVLRRLIKDKELDKEKTVYVGDEIRDIEAAKEVGMKSVAVTWGFNMKKLLLKAKPDWLIENPEELLKIFN